MIQKYDPSIFHSIVCCWLSSRWNCFLKFL